MSKSTRLVDRLATVQPFSFLPGLVDRAKEKFGNIDPKAAVKTAISFAAPHVVSELKRQGRKLMKRPR